MRLTLVVSVAESLARVDDIAAAQMHWVTVAIACLAVRGPLLAGVASHSTHGFGTSKTTVQQSTQVSTATALLMAGGLTTAALLAVAFNLVALLSAEIWLNAMMMSVAAIAAWL